MLFRSPPLTDPTVTTIAIKKARLGAAIIIGIISMCGGIGKNELSMKAMKPNTHNEYWLSENDKVQSYNRLSIIKPILK